MSRIQVANLTFAYDTSYDTIFENVSFQMDTDWKLGFIGRNGRGKTTFFNLLLGKYSYSGSIAASTAFSYFPLMIKDKSLNTLNIVEEIDADYTLWELQKELTKLQLEEDVLYRSFSTLSMGEQTKLLLAVLFLKEGNFLLIDEPTNHLDVEARAIVSDYLHSKKGFILISHDRDFLDYSVDHILSINKNNIEVQKGNFSSWYYNKEMQDQYELAEHTRLKKDIHRLTVAARQTKAWGDKVESTKIGRKSTIHEKNIDTRAYIGEKSRRMQQRRKNLEQRQQKEIGEKSQLLQNVETVESLKILPLHHHTDNLAELENIRIYYDDKQVCNSVNLCVRQGDRIALQGKNGSGKSSLLKLLLGEKISYQGKMQRASNLIISYVSQDTSFLKGDLTDYAKEYGIEESLFKAILRKLDFTRVQFEKKMETFSEGQKKKVLIARSLCERAHLYIWDEPLNYIDVFSRMQIEELLLTHKPTLLFVEHDKVFKEKIATEEIEVQKGR